MRKARAQCHCGTWAGKVLKQPVYALLGGQRPERAPVYDGSIYFADLLPEYAQRWQDRFKQKIDQGAERGGDGSRQAGIWLDD